MGRRGELAVGHTRINAVMFKQPLNTIPLLPPVVIILLFARGGIVSDGVALGVERRSHC